MVYWKKLNCFSHVGNVYIYSHLVCDSADVNIARPLLPMRLVTMLWTMPVSSVGKHDGTSNTILWSDVPIPSSTVGQPYTGDMLDHILSNIARLRVAALTSCSYPYCVRKNESLN